MPDLYLFPNTGHQFFAIDLEKLLLDTKPAGTASLSETELEQLEKFVKDQQLPESSSDQGSRVAGWHMWDPNFLPWVLYRYDFVAHPRKKADGSSDKDELRPTLMLAVESNYGDFDRGIVVGISPADTMHPGRGLDRRGRGNSLRPKEQSSGVPPYFTRSDGFESQWDTKEQMYCTDLHQILRDSPESITPIPLPCEGLPEAERGKYKHFTFKPKAIRIVWKDARNTRGFVDVDLMVDLGNSRTVALLLEDHGPKDFSNRVFPLMFLPLGWDYKHPKFRHGELAQFGIIDSWVLLHRSPFASIEPPEGNAKLSTLKPPGKSVNIHMIDQCFTAISPVLIGGGDELTGAMHALARGNELCMTPGNLLHRGSPFSLSSPKRYAWDDCPVDDPVDSEGEWWVQVPNEYDATHTHLVDFSGLIRLMTHPKANENLKLDIRPPKSDEGNFELEAGYDAAATYPRSHAICWFALAIMEAAYRQMNSCVYIADSGVKSPDVPRRLRRVRVTYPTGWTSEERKCYFKQWERAIKLFCFAHLDPNDLPDPENLPIKLIKDAADEPIDEAVASQLPLVAGEIYNMNGDVAAWLKLFGNGNETRILSLDIGGGTTDIAIVSYKSIEGKTQELTYNIEYRDGHTHAGDELVHRLIERLLLPTWLNYNGNASALFSGNTEKAPGWLKDFFKNRGETPANAKRLAKIVRLALIPLANKILTKVNETESDAESAPSSQRQPSVTVDCADPKSAPDAKSITDINKLVVEYLRGKKVTVTCSDNKKEENFPFDPSAKLEFKLEDIHQIIEEVFGKVVRGLAEVVHDKDGKKVNMVVVSGKPSELRHMRTILRRELPLSGQRIIRICEQWTDNCFPKSLEHNGFIRDAKTATVIGAAIKQDMFNGNFTDLIVRKGVEVDSPHPTWGIYGSGGTIDNSILPDTSCDERLYEGLNFTTRFGRRLTDNSIAEPVYRLEYVSENPDEVKLAKERRSFVKIKVTIKRNRKTDGFGDTLEVKPGSVTIVEGGSGLKPECVNLRLHTIADDSGSFWMDKPRFDVDFSGISKTGAK